MLYDDAAAVDAHDLVVGEGIGNGLRRLFVEVSYAVAEAAVKTGVAKCPPADLAAYKAELVRRNEERM